VILILGGGDFAQHLKRALEVWGNRDAVVLERRDCDVTRLDEVVDALSGHPDAVVCTAGLSDRIIGVSIREVLDANLYGPMLVGTVSAAKGIPCLLVASTAGIVPGKHVWYGPAKAGVINFVRAQATVGARIWALSPGRMDTAMRQADWPDEDRHTRLLPAEVAIVAVNILNGEYAPGANVVIRKVGLDRVDIYEDAAPVLPSLL